MCSAPTANVVANIDCVPVNDPEHDSGVDRLRIRVLGIDTPETKKPGYTVGCWGPEATAFAQSNLVEAHADNTSDFLDAAHGWGGVRNVLVVPGDDTELVSLAQIACTTYEAEGGMAAIAAVRDAEPNITLGKKDPTLILDAPTLLENFAVTYYALFQGSSLTKRIVDPHDQMGYEKTRNTSSSSRMKSTFTPSTRAG